MTEREQIAEFVRVWKAAGPELEVVRRAEVEAADTRETIAALESAFNYARALPPRDASGLVEMQRYFKRVAAADTQ